jgi:hypothetical protein
VTLVHIDGYPKSRRDEERMSLSFQVCKQCWGRSMEYGSISEKMLTRKAQTALFEKWPYRQKINVIGSLASDVAEWQYVGITPSKILWRVVLDTIAKPRSVCQHILTLIHLSDKSIVYFFMKTTRHLSRVNFLVLSSSSWISLYLRICLGQSRSSSLLKLIVLSWSILW